MFMCFKETVPNLGLPGLNPRTFGYETCLPGYSYGLTARTHWILHYVESGFGTYTRDGKTYEVKPGEIFVIPPLLETSYQADKAQPWSYIWIGFTLQNGELEELFSQPVYTCPEAGDIFRSVRQCLKMESGKNAYLAGCLWEIAALLKEQGKKKPDAVDLAVSCIQSEFSDNISVQQIADRLGIARSYLSNLFSARIGIPPRRYLRNYRLETAAELMTRYGTSPVVAARSTGNEDLFHFSKSFKQHFGVSPREYVRRVKS